MNCQAAISQQMEADLATEDAALVTRLEDPTLTSMQIQAITNTTAKRKEQIRKAAATRSSECE